jgi:hypothetical protein
MAFRKILLMCSLFLIFFHPAVAVEGHQNVYDYSSDYDISEMGELNYSYLSENWDHSRKIDMSEQWDGDRTWGGPHKVFAVRIDSQSLINSGKMRRDCGDIRIAWKGQVVASRVQPDTCSTEDTWIRFSNGHDGDEIRFDPNEKVEEIEVFYGNPDPEALKLRVSPSNNNPATNVHPEGPIETYYGTHQSTTYVDHDTHLHDRGVDSGEAYQDWHVDFTSSQYGDQNPDTIYISDDDGNSASESSPGDYYTVKTGDYSWLEPGDDVTVYFNSWNTDSSQVTKQMPTINEAPDKPSSPSPSDGGTADGSPPEISVDVSDPDNDNMDVTFYQGSISSQQAEVGEAGARTSMGDDNWYSESYSSYSFGERPLIFSTTQTTNGGQDPSSAHLRNIDTNGFDTQHCEFEGGDGCDTHNQEENGWLALEPSQLDGLDGVDYGTFQTNSGSGSYTVSFSGMSETPIVFAQSQTSDGAPTRNTQVHSVSSSGASIEFCEQESNDGCEGHTSERVAWLAIDRSQITDKTGFDYGTVNVDDSNWNNVNFDQSFSNPVVIADVQTENGGQEALYPEANNVGTGGADVRYCESEANDNCDTHAQETVAWMAIDQGALTLSTSSSSSSDTVTRSWSGSAHFDTQSININNVQDVQGMTTTDSGNDAYGHAHSGSTTLYIELYDPGSGSWNRVWSNSISGSQNMYGISTSFSTQDVGRIRIGCSNHQNNCYHSMGNLEFDFDVETWAGSEIDTDNSVSSGTEASVTFDGANCGNSYNWYAVASDGQEETASDTFSFDVDCNDPPSIDSGPSFSDGSTHSFTASAEVSDPDGNLDECDFEVVSSSGSQTYTDSNPGSTCSVSGISYDEVNAGHTENVDVTVTARDSYGETDSASGSHSFPNNAPSPSDLLFTDYISEHAFNVTATVDEDDNGDNELDACDWRFESGSDTYTETTSPQGTSGDYECHFENFSNAVSGFEVGDDVDVTLTARDIHGATGTASGTETIGNDQPVYSEPKPPNMSVVSDEVPELSVLVNDPEDPELNVYFRNSDDGALIGKDTVRPGKRASTDWNGLYVGRTYDWYVQVSDGYTNNSNSAEPWNFTKTLSGDYRLRSEINHRYTAIITSVGKPSYVSYQVLNPISSNKTVTTELSGVNAEFSDGSQEKTYELGPYGREEFQIQIEPDDNGTQYLTVRSTEQTTGIQNEDRMEILVKELQTSTGRAEQVPGLQLIQLMVLIVAGAFFFLHFS